MTDRTEAPALPPHSIEAEQSILGAIMLDNAVLDRVNGGLTGEDFYNAGHRVIFEHQRKLHDAGQPIDVTTLYAALEADQKADYVGGMAYLGTLVQNVPTAGTAEHYAAIVRERAERRRVAAAALDVHRAAMNPRGITLDELQTVAHEAFRPAAPVLWRLPDGIGEDEFEAARIAPDCIIEDYLYADVATLIAPGGTGKTTLLLYESVHTVLGRALYGLPIKKKGPVLIVTAEDPREMLIARLRAICNALELSAGDRDIVRRDVRIMDVCGAGFRLTRVVDDVVVPTPAVESFIEQARSLAPVVVTFDPAISFGVGESRVNDAEQGLIEAARRIRSELNCCVRYVHHSGKQNAREKIVDQYAGRGGSTLPDGARMVAVAQPMTPDEWQTATSNRLLDGETAMLLARPKLSYRPPQPDILLSRTGYAFTHTARPESDPAGKLQAGCDQIVRLLEHDLGNGTRHTQRSLESLSLMPRPMLRDVVATLIARGRIQSVARPEKTKGGPQTYLRPQAAPSGNGAP